MNAPAKAAELAKPSLQLLALTSLVPSLSHAQVSRRARFTKEELKILAEDIARNGLIQQPLVRPIDGGKWEIVAGERRWLACKLAGLTQIYVNVRELSDDQALEMQLSENLQRKDLHELEEAEGYEELMKLKKITADQVAELIDQSRSYVYARLKLLALCPEARKAFYAGELDASRALLIARIGHHDTQRQALNDILKGHGYGPKEPMSYRAAHKHIVDTYMLQLSRAPFDIKDANLLAKAGDCVKCPKRTGNQADLFGDVKGADVCTDPKCFDDKRQAHFAAPRKALEAKGKRVIFGADAKKIFRSWESQNAWARDRLEGSQYVMLDEVTYAGGRSRKVSELVGEDYEPILIQHPATGQILKVATQQAITKAASSNRGRSSASKKSGGGAFNYSKTRELERKIERETKAAIFAAIHTKVTKVGTAEFLAILDYVTTGSADLQMIGALWGWKLSSNNYANGGKFEKLAAKLPPEKLYKLLFEATLSEKIENDYDTGELLKQAKRLKIDAAAIAATVKQKLSPKPVDKVNASIDKRAATAKAKKKPAATKSKAKGKKK